MENQRDCMIGRGFIGILLLILLGAVKIDEVSSCPSGCQCVAGNTLKVYCSDGKHTSIPRGIPCHITAFTLSHNFVRRVRNGSFLCQQNMVILDLSNNRINAIEAGAFDKIVSLVKLNIRGNFIATLPSLLLLTQLLYVDVSSNNFSEWPTQFPIDNKYLIFKVDNNPMETVKVLNEIDMVSIRGTQALYVDSCSFHHPAFITILMFSYGKLETIGSMSKLSSSRFIGFSHNRIKIIKHGAFDNLASLEELQLNRNLISSLPVIRNSSLLNRLDLDDNIINSLTRGALTNLPLLKNLNLKRNRIMHFSSAHVPNICNLAINSNLLQQKILVLSNLPSMSLINFANNHVQELYIGEGVNIEHMFAYNNSIRSIRFDGSHNITMIHAGYNKISSVKIFRNLHSLRLVYLHFNQISIWNDSGLTNLTRLFRLQMKNNFIHELSNLPSLPSLEYLDLSFNRIRRIQSDALKFPALVKLFLMGNCLTHIPVLTSMANLRYLHLSENHIVNVTGGEIGKIPSLQDLYLDSNRLQCFPSLPSNQINVLNLKNNNISFCQRNVFENYHALINVIMDGNNVESTPQFPASLESLSLDNNRIKGRDNSLEYLPSGLRILNLKGNNISLEEITWIFSQSLAFLDLSSNALTEIRPFFFYAATYLKTLKLSHNSLSSLEEHSLQGLQRINFIHLQWNNLKYLSENTFNCCPLLHTLDISGNPLHAITGNLFSDLSALTHLSLSHTGNIDNASSFSPFHHLPSLRYLYLANTHIVSKWCSNSSYVIRTGLIAAFFQRNNLSYNFPRIQATSLLILNLSYNLFQAVPGQLRNGSSFPFLRNLDLSWNEIKMIRRTDFSHFVKLHRLFLNNNYIFQVTHGAFHTFKWLDLGNNNLSSILKIDLPFFPNGLKIDFAGNPWHCNLQLISFVRRISQFSVPPVCDTPSIFANQSYTSLTIGGENFTTGEQGGNTFPIEDQRLFVYVSDLIFSFHCPLNATNRQEIVWTLPDTLTLGRMASPGHHLYPVSVDKNGSLVITFISKLLSGVYACSLPGSGEMTQAFLRITVVDCPDIGEHQTTERNVFLYKFAGIELRLDTGLNLPIFYDVDHKDFFGELLPEAGKKA
ncbi:toll-like receptor 13 [Lytechinus variegatus]|uniref:toll-like receptor 13 n=1 Tax=Lytechinus variegatus TaxID=7654 RepID=UPI001BB2BE17|nr:toll-like receptor 13 [Lytechinus variegatus]